MTTSSTFALVLVQGARNRIGFRYKPDGITAMSLSGYEGRMQARKKESQVAGLIIDMTPYLAVDSADDTVMWADIPAGATAAIDAATVRSGASWDLFIWPAGTEDDAILLIEGTFALNPATTDMRDA